MEENYDKDGMRRVQWAKRKERMQREKRRQMMMRKISKIAIPVMAVFLVILVIIGVKNYSGRQDKSGKNPAGAAAAALGNADGAGAGMDRTADGADGTDVQPEGDTKGDTQAAGDVQPENTDGGGSAEDGSGGAGDNFTASKLAGEYKATERTTNAGDDLVSSYAIFVDIDEGHILMRKEATSRMNPASMTKVLTLLVAVEHIDNLDDTFTMTSEITDYCLANDCSNAGFEKGDVVPIRDLLYGAILPSGADAALGLAVYVAGSQEAFVEMMNEKLKELGLADTAHFTNCVGIYDANHYCTVYDMAVIMENAVNNDVCRKVMSVHTYTTSPTKRFSQGIELSNWFLRRIEDKDTGGEVVCGKTGYVAQSGNCAVSYGVDRRGKRYVCVTANATSKWRCIEDHAYMYKKYSE